MAKAALTRHSSALGTIWPNAGAPGQCSSHALATERGRQGSRGWSGADRSSSGSGGPEASPT
eukprot:14714790-Alexandrium_andersonii.AAC.1